MSDYETAQQLFDALSAPFPSEAIDWRVGNTNKKARERETGDSHARPTKGQALAYIDARAVMDRLDSVCGPDGWQCNYTPASNMLICNIGVQMPDGQWVWKSDGAGQTDYEAEKGMASDSFKRAAVRWGIGRYLYDLDSPWVDLNERGQMSDATRKKLDELHEKEAQKAQWGSRPGVQAYRFLLRIVQEFVRHPSDVADFREKNKGMIPLLPVAMRRHLESELDRIGSNGEDDGEAMGRDVTPEAQGSGQAVLASRGNGVRGREGDKPHARQPASA